MGAIISAHIEVELALPTVLNDARHSNIATTVKWMQKWTYTIWNAEMNAQNFHNSFWSVYLTGMIESAKTGESGDKSSASGPGRNRNILVVDDNQIRPETKKSCC